MIPILSILSEKTFNELQADMQAIENGQKPKYVVVGPGIGFPLLRADVAIDVYCQIFPHDQQTTIWNMTEYDWETNPQGYKICSLADPKDVEFIDKHMNETAVRMTGKTMDEIKAEAFNKKNLN